MTPAPQLTGTAEKMKAVKRAVSLAPDGPQKTTAQAHLTAAEQALAAHHDGECNRELDSATYALA